MAQGSQGIKWCQFDGSDCLHMELHEKRTKMKRCKSYWQCTKCIMATDWMYKDAERVRLGICIQACINLHMEMTIKYMLILIFVLNLFPQTWI